MTHPRRPETVAAHAASHPDPLTGAVIPPLHLSTTYERDEDLGYGRGRCYARADNPSFDAAAATLNGLEGGTGTLLFASGMAAATAVFQALAPGDHVVVGRVMYWALRAWLTGAASRWGLEVSFVDTADLDAVRAALRPGRTKLVWAETPANPLWTVSDIAALAELAHAAGARLAVDSTAATPVLTRPLSLGADLVVHSASKYLNGHSDVIAGTVTAARADEFWTAIKAVQVQQGGVPGAFEAWLLQRGLRTLFVRVRAAAANADQLAHFLASHPAVRAVRYPGLANDPGHAVARTQMHGGFGAMLSLQLAGGAEHAKAVAGRLRLFRQATSLGAVESLVEHRASVEGVGTRVPDDLLRVSVGIEAVEDLLADWAQALAE
jgi:cystathionine gamma-synthase